MLAAFIAGSMLWTTSTKAADTVWLDCWYLYSDVSQLALADVPVFPTGTAALDDWTKRYLQTLNNAYHVSLREEHGADILDWNDVGGRQPTPTSILVGMFRYLTLYYPDGTPWPYPAGEYAERVMEAPYANPIRDKCRNMANRYTIKLSNDGTPPSSGNLAEVETSPSLAPGKDTATLRATVYDNNNQPQPGITVTLRADVVPQSGGHSHHDENRPKGNLGGTTPTEHVLERQITGPDGAVQFTFKAPKVAGDHTITANCDDVNCGSDSGKVWVGIKDLFALESNGPAYTLIEPNTDVYHPVNHYLTTNAYFALVDIATVWHTLYKPFGPLLYLNDASLERGGAFDIDRLWGANSRPRHSEHRRGTVIDVRANNAPGAINEADFLDFNDLIMKKRPASAAIHCDKAANGQCIISTRHFHVRLLGRSE